MTPENLTALTLPAASEDWEEWVRSRAESGLSRARELVQALREEPPAEAVEVLRCWDAVHLQLGNTAAMGSLLGNVHPEESVRTTAEKAEQDVSRMATELSLDRGLYELFAGLSADGLDEQATRLLEKVQRDFRRSGVDRDEATRTRIAAINERLTEVDQEFSKVIRDDVRTIEVAPERLAGLPADWLEAHPVGDDGLVTVTTDYPDAVPTRMFAHDADVRREMYDAFLNRGWPTTEPLLQELFALRHELAGLVGFDDWAAYDAEVKMIGTGPAIPEFIDRIAQAAQAPMERDLAVLTARYQQDNPDAERVLAADASYYEELVRKEQLEVDSQKVRTYFAFDKVRAGLLEVTGRLFGLRYDPVPDAPVWDADVTVYDVVDTASGDGLGRIYLDLHPRDGKYKHAAQFTLTDGVAGRQLPEGVLVCNFSRGLMEHDHVVTLFHEFGHLVHHTLGGHVGWARFAGVATEWDFVEAPSQMLEEWAWDADILRSFATDDVRRADPGRAGRGDAAQRRLRQGLHGAGADVLRRDVVLVPRRASHRPHRDDGRAAGALLAVAVPRGHAHVRLLRPPRRLQLGVLHLHVVAGDRQGPLQRLRPRRPLRPGRGAPLPRPGAGTRRHAGRRRPRRRLPRQALHVRRLRGLAGRLRRRPRPYPTAPRHGMARTSH